MANMQLCHCDNAVLPWGPHIQNTIQEVYTKNTHLTTEMQHCKTAKQSNKQRKYKK